MNRATELSPADYEPTDGAPRPIAGVAIALAVSVALTLLVCAWIYRAHYRAASPTRATAAEFSFRNGAHARTSIERDWADQDRLTREHLDTYGWVDRRAGIVRIPIERAMDQLAIEATLKRGGGKP